jgi:hypothetical protein
MLVAAPVFAGPVDTPVPPNPCLGGAPLAIAWVANEVGTDSGGPVCPLPGSGCAETLVVCHHNGKTGAAPIDVAVELFDSTSSPLAGSFTTHCGVPAGGSAAFVTLGAPLLPPYLGSTIIAAAVPQVPLGSLRVLSTSTKAVVCDVTLLDTTTIGAGFTPSPGSAKNVTLTAQAKGQRGD